LSIKGRPAIPILVAARRQSPHGEKTRLDQQQRSHAVVCAGASRIRTLCFDKRRGASRVDPGRPGALPSRILSAEVAHQHRYCAAGISEKQAIGSVFDRRHANPKTSADSPCAFANFTAFPLKDGNVFAPSHCPSKAITPSAKSPPTITVNKAPIRTRSRHTVIGKSRSAHAWAISRRRSI
jgi:hypothetical protein